MKIHGAEIEAPGQVFEHIPEGFITAFVAPQRRGKTLGCVWYALEMLEAGRKIYSNLPLAFEHEHLEFEQIELEQEAERSRFWNSLIFVDELNFWFDCRRSMSEDNIKYGQFMLQQKKQGCHLIGTTHEMRSLDYRFRAQYDFEVHPTVYPAYPARPKLLRLDFFNGPQQPFTQFTKWVHAEPLLGLYNTFHVYNPFKHREEVKARKRERPESRLRL